MKVLFLMAFHLEYGVVFTGNKVKINVLRMRRIEIKLIFGLVVNEVMSGFETFVNGIYGDRTSTFRRRRV